MSLKIMMRVFPALLAALVLSGCYFSNERLFPDGEPLTWAERITCTGEFSNDRPFTVDLKAASKTSDGVEYALHDPGDNSNIPLTFKRIEDDLYLIEVRDRTYKYGYALRQGQGFNLLSFGPGDKNDTMKSAKQNNVLISSASQGWSELVGRKADVRKFLMSPRIAELAVAGRCSFASQASKKQVFGILSASATKDEALKLPGAEACDSDVCLSGPPLGFSDPTAGLLRIEFDTAGLRRAVLSIKDTGIRPDRKDSLIAQPEATEWTKSIKSMAPLRVRLNNETTDMWNDAKIRSAGREKLNAALTGFTDVVEKGKRGYVKISSSEPAARVLIAGEKNYESVAKILKLSGYAIFEMEYNRKLDGGPLSLETSVSFAGR